MTIVVPKLHLVCAALLLATVLQPFSRVIGNKIAPEIQLLETGEFHGNEVKAKTGEQWLGLFQSANGFALRSSTIVVDRVADPVLDEDETTKKSGKRVSVHGHAKPIFLIKGATMLPPGPVVTVFKEAKSLGNGATIQLQLKGKRYQLSVVSQDPEPKDYLVQNTKLVLTDGKTSQTLVSLGEPNDAGWSLFWAGDIDRDGKLDLYMDLSTHYNASSRQLFLSSQAGKGKLVRELARFVTVGC